MEHALYTTLSTAGIAIEENLVRICLVLFFYIYSQKQKGQGKQGENMFLFGKTETT